ncbi:uncharacterized protein LOC141673863 [Apium graveolens]|uniref:uncharacterized protein LOC141673863 n=1 Tax=Apium graveolens TaxID=4045 RepID=UPI003D7AF641
MDKSWIFKDRDTLDYEIGVEEFLIFAEENASDPKRIPCPWSASRSSVNRNAPTPASTPAPAPTSARAPIPSPGLASETVNICDAAYNSSEYNNESYQFRRFVADAEQPLYEGSECTKLESMLKLHNWKARFGISDSAFNDLLSTVGSLLPKDNTKFLMLTILVSGPHELGNDVDVYLQPLIDDLKKLWEEGEPNVYDVYTKSYFTLKAILLWTINDFPAYGNLSGCVNKGYMCCPVCADDTTAKYLSHSRKMCYQGHRRYLARNHPYRKQKAAFNGQQELGQARQPLSGEEVLLYKVVDVSKLDKLQSDVIVTLCELEKIFPASFFDIMIHLIVYLVRELRLCGPVFYIWMYAFERFNKVLKSYVRNRYYPEGCIAECYLEDESVEFCQEFVKQACTTAGLRKDEGKLSGPLSVVTMKSIKEKERDEAHLHVLLNNIEVHPYILMHKEYLEGIHQGKKKSVHWLLREHNRLFADWFLEKVSSEMEENPGGVSETIRWIAGKPSFSVLTYEAYLVDGVRYFTKERDSVRVIQNSGVSLVAKTVQGSSAKDLNPVESDLIFYGVILEIWDLDYHAFKAPLFLCNWEDNDKGIKVDDLGFTLVDLSRQGHKRDKYVSMDQVKQVYYIEDPMDAKWSVVLTSTT